MGIIDRVPCWLVSVSFPISHLANKENLMTIVESLANSRGGEIYMFSEPAKEFLGREGYTDFGCSVVFEQGDANLDSFVQLLKEKLSKEDVVVGFDPEDILYPEESSFSL